MTPEDEARLRASFEAALARWEAERRDYLANAAERLDAVSASLPPRPHFGLSFSLDSDELFPQVDMPDEESMFDLSP